MGLSCQSSQGNKKIGKEREDTDEQNIFNSISLYSLNFSPVCFLERDFTLLKCPFYPFFFPYLLLLMNALGPEFCLLIKQVISQIFMCFFISEAERWGVRKITPSTGSFLKCLRVSAESQPRAPTLVAGTHHLLLPSWALAGDWNQDLELGETQALWNGKVPCNHRACCFPQRDGLSTQFLDGNKITYYLWKK